MTLFWNIGSKRSSQRTVQAKTAMNENSKIQIVSNDMVRRLLNTMEGLEAPMKGAVVDQYATKLLKSGYNLEQTRKIVKNGIKGYEHKRRSRTAKGIPLRSTGKMSRSNRFKEEGDGQDKLVQEKEQQRQAPGE